MTQDLDPVLRRARQGDATALDHLLLHEQEFLAAQVQRQLDSSLRSLLEPEDVLQETRLRVVRSIGHADFDTLGSFRGWLTTIVRNVVIDLRRRHLGTRKRGTAVSLEANTATSQSGITTSLRDRVKDDEPGPSSIVRRKEDASLLHRAIAQLKPHHREILQLVQFERLRLTDIAVRTGRKPSTVRKELERAIKACRQILDGMQGKSGTA
ncbi:MAG: sigma-70 family RNA polymerase sigma factor [Planctomycetes bacterium]|nr:sigma-70 family RNA polymerase sigma factor [Planctomycetota bacterium]